MFGFADLTGSGGRATMIAAVKSEAVINKQVNNRKQVPRVFPTVSSLNN
jgi:hypothetical protein